MRKTTMNLPVRLRLTLWYVGLLAGALLLFGTTVYVLMSHSLESNLDASLQQRINQIVPTLDVSDGHVRLTTTGEQSDTPSIPAALLSAAGQPTSVGIPPTLSDWLRHHGASLPQRFAAATAGSLRFATFPIENNNRRAAYIVGWQSTSALDGARRSLLVLLLGLGPGLLMLAGVGGTFVARRALVPVEEITHAAAGISATDLHRRVPEGRTNDELSRLARTFNAMIQRVESAVERERRFTSDASHEFRAPLAVILAEASLALERPLDADEYHRALGMIHEQATGMNEMIAALLLLARVETIEGHEDVISLADVVERAVRQCAITSRERNVRIVGEVNPGFHIRGHRTLLTRAVRNVLDNALKVSPVDGSVRFHTSRHDEHIVLEIEDDGPGIASDNLERIFEPFYQIEQARTPGDSHGLGLAICRRIVRAHGGSVVGRSTPGDGATFAISLPWIVPDLSESPISSKIAPAG